MQEVSDSELEPDPNATPVAEMVKAESSGNPNAVSKKGARGLMQIMPANAKAAGIDPNKLFDPSTNVDLGSKLYQQNLRRFGGDKRKALAAYNWGPGNVEMHPNETDWPKETRDYVNKIAGAPKEASSGIREVTDDEIEGAPPALPSKGNTREQVEARRHAVEGGGTDMSDPLIENLAIGGVTGGMGPGLAGVGARALGAAGGTAEQYLYGWLADQGQKYGTQMVGPKTGIAASIILPLLGGVAEGKALNSLSRLRAPVSAAQESAAKAAATSAESELYEKTPKQIFEYGEDIEAANKKALTKTKGAFERAGALRAQAGQALTASDQAAQQDIQDKAAQQIMQDYFGRSPEETAAARRLPFEDLALHRANMRNAVFGPINRIGKALGGEFNKAAAGREGEVVGSTEQLSKSVADAQSWVNEREATLSEPVNNLISRLPKSGATADEADEILHQLYSQKKIDEMSPATKKFYLDAFRKGKTASESEVAGVNVERPGVNYPTGQGPSADALETKTKLEAAKPEGPTIGQLLGWRTEASNLVASQHDHNQVVAMQLRDALDQSLMDAGVKIPQPLREQWSLYKNMFDHPFRRKVATAVNPLGYGRKLFESPEHALAIWRGATPDERESLKQLLVDHVYASKYSPKTFTKKIDAGVLHEYFGGTPYEKLAPWVDGPAKSDAWSKAVAENPAIETQIKAGQQSALAEISQQRARDVRDAGIRLAQKMGPAGKGKLAKILATRDPIAAAKIVEQEFPFTPEAAQNIYRKAQMNPARQMFQKGIGHRALTAEGVNETREQAAVQALMQNQDSKLMAGLKRRLYAWHLPMLVGTMGMGAIGGHAMGGGYQAGISGMIIGMMAAENFRAMLRPALTDPEAAREYWRAIDSVPSTLNARKFGARMMRMAIAVGTSNLERQNQTQDQNQ